MKILFFIGTLEAGGKERRLIELLNYLKKNTNFDLMVVLRQKSIHYDKFREINIPYELLTKTYKKKDLILHINFFKICKKFKPDIIHTWGSMPAFVSLPAVIFLRIPHLNSQITDAPPAIKRWSFENLINRINFKFSKVILANSYAGLRAYGLEPNGKNRVIYNGVDLSRFQNLEPAEVIKRRYSITTPYAIIMAASFTNKKDYDLFYRVSEIVTQVRNDTTFIGVGGGSAEILENMIDLAKDNPRILFLDRIKNVESLINSCDICILFSSKTHGEGISNSIIEYMALGKAVIANDAGGTIEILQHLVNGYLVTDETKEKISQVIVDLLNNRNRRTQWGNNAKKTITSMYSIDRMGKEFLDIYRFLVEEK